MQTLLSQIAAFLIQPPGNLVYHLALSCALVAALQSALFVRQIHPSPAIHRIINGISILLAAQLLLFILSAVTWQGQTSPQFLPPLDRAIVAFSVIWGIWLWTFPEPSKPADMATWMASIAIAILFAFTLFSWQPSTNPVFNQTWLDLSWTLIILILAITGIVLIAIRRRQGWIGGLAFILMIAIGAGLHLMLGHPDSNYAGAIRAAQVIAFPLLIGLARMHGESASKKVDIDEVEPAEMIAGEQQLEPDLPLQITHDTDVPLSTEILQLREENASLRLALESAQSSNTQTSPSDYEALVALQQESDAAIAQLESENARLQAALETLSQSESTTSLPQHYDDLQISRQRIAELEVLVDQLHTRLAQQRAVEERESRPIQGSQAGVPDLIRDLRQPVSAIFGYIDLLLGDTAGILGASQRHYIERIKASMERLLTILEELSHASAKEPAGFTITTLSLPELIDQATSKTSPLFRAKSLALRIQVEPGIPQIEADRMAILQVLVTLMKYSAEASPVGGTVRLQVEKQVYEKDQFILLKLTDSSGGIGQEAVSSLFTRKSHSLDSDDQTEYPEQDSMSMAKSLVDAHGGRIWAESQLGISTTIFLLIPAESTFGLSSLEK